MFTICHTHYGYITHSYIKASSLSLANEQALKLFSNIISIMEWKK